MKTSAKARLPVATLPEKGLLEGILVGKGVKLDLSYQMLPSGSIRGTLLAGGRQVRLWDYRLARWERALAVAGLLRPRPTNTTWDRVVNSLYTAYQARGPRSLRGNGENWDFEISYTGVADGTYHIRYYPRGNYADIDDRVSATCWDP